MDLVTVYLGLGSNLGDRQCNLLQALDLLAEKMRIARISSLYETEPVGWSPQPLFLNAVCQATTSLDPEELLALIKGIEAVLGREPSFPNAPRTMDIDILLYGNQIINTAKLVVPHPRLEERAFVLVPLAEIAPDLVHPVSQRRIKEQLEKVLGLEGIKEWSSESKNV